MRFPEPVTPPCSLGDMALDPTRLRSSLRAAGLRLTKRGRRRLAREHGALHSRTRRPGLVHVDEETTVDSGGIAIQTYMVGPADAEATVVFIHGFTLAAEVYYMQVDYLQKHFPQVKSVLFDVRGHGRTGQVPPELCTIAGTADDALATIRTHAPTGPLIIVGHSLGGLTALNLVKRADAELRGRIRGIILTATSIESLSAQGLPQILASPVAEKVRDTTEASPDEVDAFRDYISSFIAPALSTAVFKRPINDHVVEFHAAMIHETPLDTFVGFFDDLQEHDELDAAPALAGMDGYVLAGENDDVTPLSQSERICELWPNAKRQIAEGAGHMLPLEAPGILNNAIHTLLVRVLGEPSTP